MGKENTMMDSGRVTNKDTHILDKEGSPVSSFTRTREEPMLVKDVCINENTTNIDATTTTDGMIFTTTTQLEQEMTPDIVADLMILEESEFG